VDPYSLMSSYYPYYPTDDMTAVAGNVWSTGDALAYGYGSDYGTVMTDYGYGYGWFPPGVDGSGWGTPTTIQPTVKDELGNAYAPAAPGGYYTVPVYGGGSESMGSDGAVAAVEQGMQGMNIADAVNHEMVDAGSNGVSNGSPGGAKTWAAVAGQPATYRSRNGGAFPPLPMPSGKLFGGSDSGASWDGRDYNRQAHDGWAASRRRPTARPTTIGTSNVPSSSDTNGTTSVPAVPHHGPYNPKEFDLNPKGARFFIIKSYAEDDIHRSIKYGIWCSTEYGNKRLDSAYREREGKGPMYLFFSVNGSGHFCGVAQMMSAVDHQSSANVWTQNKWKGRFSVNWIYVKDVPNSQLRHIRLENNEGKPVTNSRDTQEVPPEKGCQVLRVIHQYRNTTSIFDDFSHYEKLQTENNIQNVRRSISLSVRLL